MSTRWLHAATSLTLAALLGASVLTWSRRAQLQAGEHYAEQLSALQAHQLALTAEVLKARSGLSSHYDAIVQSQAAITRSYAELQALPALLPATGRHVFGSELTAARALARDSERLVERFKREQAVLRNSLHYLPALARELDERSEHEAALAPLVQRLHAIVRDELLLQLWQDDGLLERIASQLRQLQADSGPDAVRNASQAVTLHARTVLERTPLVNDLTRRIVTMPGVARTRALVSLFTQYQQAARRAVDADTIAVFALALLALGLSAGSVIARLRQAAGSLRLASERLERALAELHAQQAKQKELADLKSRFVAMASHQFRTPLSVIMSSGELLEAYADKWAAERKAEHYARIHAAALSMTGMLDSILTIGQSDAGALRFEPAPLELGRFCEQLIDSVQARGESRRIVYAAPSPALRVLADRALLEHVLGNLLSNALKYSPAPRPVGFEVRRAGDQLVFCVRDQGIGISADDQQHLFESFHRGKNVGSVAGTGLGLAIVKRALDLHGGTLTLDSELGRGTCITVRIPCTEGQA